MSRTSGFALAAVWHSHAGPSCANRKFRPFYLWGRQSARGQCIRAIAASARAHPRRSIIYQESAFRADAQPARRKLLGFIPWFRPSTAYGYSQAKTTTWDEYKDDAGRFGADRDDFGDAIDFVGWYNHQSRRRSGIAPNNTYGLYLAYHEGHGGYNRATYLQKPWLMTVARKVEARANTYQAQLVGCEEKLKRGGGFFGWF